MPEYLFVYGTLQPGLAPEEISPVVDKLQPVGRGFACGVLYDLGAYPGALLDPRAGKIWGQVFAFPDDPEVLRRLDEYEEYYRDDLAASQFVREECECKLESGTEVTAWIYVYNRDVSSASRIIGGDFAAWRRSRS